MDDFRNITEFVDSLPSRGFPGMDVTVARDHKILYRHSAGYTDMEAGVPVSGNELYYMYSCTKVVTCAAALRLINGHTHGIRDLIRIHDYMSLTVSCCTSDGLDQ